MGRRRLGNRISGFRIVLAGFAAVILIGTGLLMLPAASRSGDAAPAGDALFTSVSAVCVTGLIVRDTALAWSGFGQAVILVLIQIGGLGVVTVAVLIAMASGRKISLMQRGLIRDSLSAHQLGGMVRKTGFVLKLVFLTELAGALAMMPAFCGEYGLHGVWMAVFLYQMKDRSYKLSMRSNVDAIDVSAISLKFGGGGHRRAAGATLGSDLAASMEMLKKEFEVQLAEYEASIERV